MNNKILVLITLASFGMIGTAYAEVFVPEDEIVSYFNSIGVYTISGVVRNTEDFPVVPTVHLTLNYDGKQITLSQTLPTVFPNTDMPFKIQVPEITSNVTIASHFVTFEKNTTKPKSGVEVLYDKSMMRHSDGHLTGRIINNGNVTEYNVKVYATVHGTNNTFLDSTKNLEQIDKIEPGQILEFTMYPDSTVAENVSYYSCFAIGDETVIPVSTTRNGEKFDFRYDSTAVFVVRGFDETGTKLSLVGINSIKFPTFVNFEFPRISDDEKFDVSMDGKPVKFLQSRDEYGNWHVAFDVDGSSQNQILISGFGKPSSTGMSGGEQNYLVYGIIAASIAVGISVYLYSKKARLQKN